MQAGRADCPDIIRLRGETMSRQTGHRDKSRLYERILDLLRKHPEGLNAYRIHAILVENDATIRTYCGDLFQQGKIVRRKEEGKRAVYQIVTEVKR